MNDKPQAPKAEYVPDIAHEPIVITRTEWEELQNRIAALEAEIKPLTTPLPHILMEHAAELKELRSEADASKRLNINRFKPGWTRIEPNLSPMWGISKSRDSKQDVRFLCSRLHDKCEISIAFEDEEIYHPPIDAKQLRQLIGAALAALEYMEAANEDK